VLFFYFLECTVLLLTRLAGGLGFGREFIMSDGSKQEALMDHGLEDID
jgi:hypothetical protein